MVNDPQAKVSIFRAIRWIKEKIFAWISNAMKEVEKKLEKPDHGMTLPSSRSG